MAIPNISEIRDGKRVIVKKPELLLPAGNLEKLKIAIHYGADAVFLGGQEFGLRSNADNFTIEEIKEGCDFAKKYGADIYVTANIIAHDENFEGLDEFLIALQEAGVRGIIVADPFIIERCKAVAPNVEVHISTQQSISNYKEVQYWESEGVHRVVLARETGYEEIKEIREKTDVEIEMFVHGAMCIAYSGRCTLSNYMTARDSNRGGCCQSCRWNYDLYEEGQEEDTKLFDEGANPYAMSPKDLTLIEAVPEIIELGIDSLKVEGRMKSIHYVATVASVYRKLIDDYCADPDNFEMTPEYKLELYKCANRDTAMSFFYEIPQYTEQMFGNEGSKKTNVEIEMFVHGAMCIAYSGRCTLSNYMTARDSNRGGCCQSCRWNYDLYEEGVEEDTKLFDEGANPYAMSPKDLTLIEAVPEIIELGIDSLKVEGRMKSIHYVATVASVYRKLIDDYCADPDNFEMTPEYKLELYKCANRDTAMSFFYEIPKYSEQMFGNEGGKKTNYDFVGQVLHYNEETQIATIQQRNFFKTGQEVEFFGPEIDTFRQVIGEIYDEDGELLDAARHPLQIIRTKIDSRVFKSNMMRKEIGR